MPQPTPEWIESLKALAQLNVPPEDMDAFVSRYSELLQHFERLRAVEVGSQDPPFVFLPSSPSPRRER